MRMCVVAVNRYVWYLGHWFSSVCPELNLQTSDSNLSAAGAHCSALLANDIFEISEMPGSRYNKKNNCGKCSICLYGSQESQSGSQDSYDAETVDNSVRSRVIPYHTNVKLILFDYVTKYNIIMFVASYKRRTYRNKKMLNTSFIQGQLKTKYTTHFFQNGLSYKQFVSCNMVRL